MPGDNMVVVAAAAFAAGGLACYLLMSGKKSKSEEVLMTGKSSKSDEASWKIRFSFLRKTGSSSV